MNLDQAKLVECGDVLKSNVRFDQAGHVAIPKDCLGVVQSIAVQDDKNRRVFVVLWDLSNGTTALHEINSDDATRMPKLRRRVS